MPSVSVKRIHAPFDRYSVAFPETGVTYLAEVEWKQTRSPRLHSHHEYQLLWILDGGMGIETNQQRHAPNFDVCYVIPPDKIHAVFQNEQSPHVVFLDLRISERPPCTMSQFLAGLSQQIVFPVKDVRRFGPVLRGALGLASAQKIARLQAVLWEMLSQLAVSSAVETESETDKGVLRLRVADDLMKDRLAQALDIEEVAAAAGISRSQLTRLYRRHHHVGPAERLRELRVQKARELLQSSTLTIKEIAHVCGFVCPNHFCRVFLQSEGLTPTEYRLAQFRLREVQS
jgi:AraC family transcriptional regulator